jgi:peptidoglycan/LPS O-acetylase OafA/YrhL
MIIKSEKSINIVNMEVKKSDFIDFARGYAILTIVLYHYCLRLNMDDFFKTAIFFGGAGVHLFIFISGFGLCLSQTKSFKEYISKRVNKVLIPYYIVITFIFLFNIFIPLYKGNFYSYLGHIFLFKMFDENIIYSFGAHFWFLSTIIQFYFIFPVLKYLKNAFGNFKFIIFCLFLSISWWLFLYFCHLYEYKTWNSFFLQFLWEFALGMICSDLYKENKLNLYKINFWGYVLTALTAAGITALLVLKYNTIGKVFNDIPSFLAYTSLAIIMYRIISHFSIFKKFFLYISKISYPLYLIHLFVIDLFIYIFNLRNNFNNLDLFIVLFIVLLLSSMYNSFFKTINKILQKLYSLLLNYKKYIIEKT